MLQLYIYERKVYIVHENDCMLRVIYQVHTSEKAKRSATSVVHWKRRVSTRVNLSTATGTVVTLASCPASRSHRLITWNPQSDQWRWRSWHFSSSKISHLNLTSLSFLHLLHDTLKTLMPLWVQPGANCLLWPWFKETDQLSAWDWMYLLGCPSTGASQRHKFPLSFRISKCCQC